jgi:hypothetical protein
MLLTFSPSGTTSQQGELLHKNCHSHPSTIAVLANSKPLYHFQNTCATLLLPDRRNEAIRLPIAPAIPHRLPIALALSLAIQSILRCYILFTRSWQGAIAWWLALRPHVHGCALGSHPRHATPMLQCHQRWPVVTRRHFAKSRWWLAGGFPASSIVVSAAAAALRRCQHQPAIDR